MREEAFRRFLAPRLGARSIDSYLSNLRRVERVLSVDVDALAIDNHVIDLVRTRLRVAGVNNAKLSDCHSALRAYAAFQHGTAVRGSAMADVPPTVSAAPTRADPAPTGLESATITELLTDYVAIQRELRVRGIARTGNGPVGDYAEHLFSRALGLTLEPNSNAEFDAHDPATHLRYEIKARRLTSAKRSAQLSALRGLTERRFDMLAVLLFAPDFSVDTAVLIAHELVMQQATYIAHTNSSRLVVTPALLALPEIKDVTRVLRAVSNSDAINT
jgi:hypothetical protein